MMPWWTASALADQRRRSLAEEMRAQRVRAEGRVGSAATSNDLKVRGLAAPAEPNSGASDGHAVSRHVGNWLIRAGTRLGGATMQTS
ncbi:MAG TPA: hypothetical protein VNG12_20190 [Acidimicrobiales bacterium]|nr:hypothetical protein [Acidimicrobiales bacterium]